MREAFRQYAIEICGGAEERGGGIDRGGREGRDDETKKWE
jgi:hypothetical protein